MTVRTRRLVFPEKNRVVVETESLGDPKAGEILVKNEVSLISPGTELAIYTGTHVGFGDPDVAWAKYPICPGYASAGSVVSIGAGTGPDTAAPRVGERVLHFSTHADHSLVDLGKSLWFTLPEGLDSRRALFARFAQISYTAYGAAHRVPERILVLGAGMIGNLTAQIFRLQGKEEVLVGDIDRKRLGIAGSCGIGRLIDTGCPDVPRAIREATGGRGVDLVVEATGVPILVAKALEWVNDFGEVILLGSTRGTVNLNVYKYVHRKKTILSGAHESFFPMKSAEGRSHESMVKDILGWIADGRLKVDPFITHTLPPERAGEGYEGLLKDKEHYLGVFIEW